MSRDYRSNPSRLRQPGYTKGVVVDTVRGKLRVRAWPKPRGKPKSARVRAQNEWFRDANHLAKKAAGDQIKTAMVMTKNTGLYPRDVILKAMAGNLGDIEFEGGKVYEKRRNEVPDSVFNGCILNLPNNLNIGTGATIISTWGVPIIDAAGYWNAGNPERLTIPTTSRICRLDANLLSDSGDNTAYRGFFQQNGVTVAHQTATTQTTNGLSISFGPFLATPGDYFTFGVIPSNSDTLVSGPRTAFTITTLETQ